MHSKYKPLRVPFASGSECALHHVVLPSKNGARPENDVSPYKKSPLDADPTFRDLGVVGGVLVVLFFDSSGATVGNPPIFCVLYIPQEDFRRPLLLTLSFLNFGFFSAVYIQLSLSYVWETVLGDSP